jgi:hypothetical protein
LSPGEVSGAPVDDVGQLRPFGNVAQDLDVPDHEGVHQAGGIFRENLHDPQEYALRGRRMVRIQPAFRVESLNGCPGGVHLHQESHAIVEIRQGLGVQAGDRGPPGHRPEGRLEFRRHGIGPQTSGLGFHPHSPGQGEGEGNPHRPPPERGPSKETGGMGNGGHR